MAHQGRKPVLLSLLAVILLLAGFLGWQGYQALQFHQQLAKAEQALKEYQFEQATAALKECIQQRPKSPPLRLLAAQAARRNGDLDEAEAQLIQYRELDGENKTDAALQWSMLFAQQGRMQEVDYLIKAIEYRHPESEQILEALAQGSIHTYNLHRATFWIRELLERYPNNPVGLWLKAETMSTMGNRKLALKELQDLVKKHPSGSKFRKSLVRMLSTMQKYEQAIPHYQVLQRQAPGDLETVLGLAHCWIQLDRTKEAEPLVREIEEKYSDNSEALLLCGQYAIQQQRLADAERLLRKAVEIAPFDHQVHLHLGICLKQRDKPEEGQKHIDRSKEIERGLTRLEKLVGAMMAKPNDPEPRLEAGQICLKYGQVSEGLRWLSGALAIDPQHKPTHQALADHFDSVGNAEKAKQHRQLAQ